MKNSGTCVLLIIWPRLVTSHFIKNVCTATTKRRDICMNKRRSTQSFPRYVFSEKLYSKLYTRPELALVLGGKNKGCGWNENERKILYWSIGEDEADDYTNTSTTTQHLGRQRLTVSHLPSLSTTTSKDEDYSTKRKDISLQILNVCMRAKRTFSPDHITIDYFFLLYVFYSINCRCSFDGGTMPTPKTHPPSEGHICM